MIVLTADDALRVLLGSLTETAEIRDPATGAVLGYFTPASKGLAAEYAPLFDIQEIARRKAEGMSGLTTAQVLERIRSLESG